MYVIVGLGNPDAKYKNTLHNLGFMAVDLLAEKLGVEFNKKGHKGVYALTTVGGEKVALLKPMTYMNLSGECLQSFLNFYKVPTANVVVLYDDLDIDIGSIRIRKSGSAGTHNGMRDIVKKLGSENFARIRVGIKPQNDSRGIIDYVLSDIKKDDEETFLKVFAKTAEALKMFLEGKKLDEIMRKYNGKVC
jgi:PTH1 family peptidyl-tRNA hydrolase